MAHVYTLERTQLVPRPRDEVFAFFSDAMNLEALTPSFLKFRVLSPQPIHIAAGTLIEYELQLFHIRFHWQTLIESYDPPHRFTDIQLKGPYRRWHHTHEFIAVPEGTLVIDRVEYEMPLGPLGALGRLLFVRRALERIFHYRYQQVERLLGLAAEQVPK